MQNKDTKFINEHILNRMPFDDCFKEETIQEQAQKAFYAVWSNWVFINPTTENLRDVTPADYATIKKLSYGTKNRLQSYIAFHLNKDHYGMDFKLFTHDESFSVINMCAELFEDTKILVDWWRTPVSTAESLTGEEWFKVCKLRFMHRKQINKIGFVFFDLNKKEYITMIDGKFSWITEQDDATRFNLIENDLIVDQELESTKEIIFDKINKTLKLDTLKCFVKGNSDTAKPFLIDISK